MSWIHEHAAETTLSPARVWAVLADLNHWADWDTSMEKVVLNGPFAVGSTVTMTPTGQDPITSVITAIQEDHHYADETSFGEMTLRFSHTLTALDNGGTRVLHRLEIDGPGGAELGPVVTEDFPEAMDALLAEAAK